MASTLSPSAAMRLPMAATSSPSVPAHGPRLQTTSPSAPRPSPMAPMSPLSVPAHAPRANAPPPSVPVPPPPQRSARSRHRRLLYHRPQPPGHQRNQRRHQQIHGHGHDQCRWHLNAPMWSPLTAKPSQSMAETNRSFSTATPWPKGALTRKEPCASRGWPATANLQAHVIKTAAKSAYSPLMEMGMQEHHDLANLKSLKQSAR